ncbi:MAG: hypothetical protein JXB88_20555 [Spirochaetales bacterium]|nr:hypothetical protein [Spirochaetales bacterium]
MNYKLNIFSLLFLLLSIYIFPSRFSLFDNMASASWKNSQNLNVTISNSVPGNENANCLVRKLNAVQLEDKNKYNNVILMVPPGGQNSWLNGEYQLKINKRSYFKAKIGFLAISKGSDGAVFEIVFRQGSNEYILYHVYKNYDKSLLNVELDFSLSLNFHDAVSITSNTIEGYFILRVLPNNTNTGDLACWIDPVIITNEASFPDPDEKGITDQGKDFKNVALSWADDSSIRIQLETYSDFTINKFEIRISTNYDLNPEYRISCSPDKYKCTGTNVNLTGVAYKENHTYTIKVPARDIFNPLFEQYVLTIQVPPGEGGDRIPDDASAGLIFTPQSCKIAYGDDKDHDTIFDPIEAYLLNVYSPYLKFSKDGGNENYPPVDPLMYVRHCSLLPEGEEDATPKIKNDILKYDPLKVLTGINGNEFSDITRTPRKAKFYLNIWNQFRDGYEAGAYPVGYTWNQIRNLKNVGLYGHVAPYYANNNVNNIRGSHGKYNDDTSIRIEFYQFFGYSDVNVAGDIGDHEADWEIPCIVTIDRNSRKIKEVLHYAHGVEMCYDTSKTKNVVLISGNWGEEHRGPNYNTGYFEIGKPGGGLGVIDTYLEKAQNNLVRFMLDEYTRLYTHPVVHIEKGCHGCWPSEHWGYYGAPKHRGDYISYQSFSPENLGEVEYPFSDTAKIIVHYNGRWGTYSIKTGKPPSPALHREWIWLKNSALYTQIPNDNFEY